MRVVLKRQITESIGLKRDLTDDEISEIKKVIPAFTIYQKVLLIGKTWKKWILILLA